MRSKNKGYLKNFFRSCRLGLAKFFGNFNFASRTRGGKAFKITFLFFIYAASIVGIVFGLINLGKNNENTGLFGKTYNTSYKLNLSTSDEKTAESLTKEATEKFTNYLVYKNVSNNNISYSVKKNSSGSYDGYIYVSYTNVAPYYDDNFKNSDTDGYYDIDPNKYAIDNEASSGITAWYFNPSPGDKTKVENFFTYSYTGTDSAGKPIPQTSSQVFSSNDFDYSSASSDSRDSGENSDDLNNYGITLKLKKSSNEYLDSAGLNTFKSPSDSSNGTTASADTDLQWVVFRNIDQLVNKLNYAKWVVFNYKYMSLNPGKYSGGIQTKWNVYYDNLKSTDSDLVTWAEKAVGTVSTNSNITAITPQYLIVAYEKALGRSFSATNLTNLSNDGDSSLLTVVKNYVVGSVTKVNYRQWFPQITSKKGTISGTNVNSFSLQPYAYESSKYNTSSSSSDDSSSSSSSSTTTATTTQKSSTRSSLISIFKKLALPVEFYTATPSKVDSSTSFGYSSSPNISLSQELTSTGLTDSNNSIVGNSTSQYFGTNSWVSNPYIEKSLISKLSAYNSIFLASGVIILLIAIIVSVLYRIPGFMGAFSIIASFAFSISLLVIFKIDISIPSILALFIGLIISVASVSTTMERMRKLIEQKNSVFDSIQTGIKKSMLTIVDLHVALMVLGISIFFISKGENSSFGISLLLSSLLSVGSLFVFFLIPMFAYSSFRFSWNVKVNMFYFLNKKDKKIKLRFSPKKWWIIWAIVLFIIILGAILLSILGLNNSIYNGGSFFYITVLGNTDSLKVDINQVFNSIKNAIGNDWTLSMRNISEYPSAVVNSITSSGYYYVVIQGYSSTTHSLDAISNLLSSTIKKYYTDSSLQTAILNSINVNVVSNDLLSSLFSHSIYALLAGYGFISIYYAVRLNALSVIPVFIVSCISTMVSIAIIYIAQIEINLLIIYVLLSSGVLSNAFSCLYISVTKTRFVRRKVFEAKKIQMFVLNNMRSLLNVIYIALLSNVIIFALLAGLVSPITIWLLISLMIVNIISIPLGFFLTAHLYYFVILIRQKYVLSIINSFDNRINSELKERDEQLILGINKFH